jgi:hypothetical protein
MWCKDPFCKTAVAVTRPTDPQETAFHPLEQVNVMETELYN